VVIQGKTGQDYRSVGAGDQPARILWSLLFHKPDNFSFSRLWGEQVPAFHSRLFHRIRPQMRVPLRCRSILAGQQRPYNGQVPPLLIK
jgi:hypothetical protein